MRNHEVHQGNAVEVPVLGVLAYQLAQLGAAVQRFAEQAYGKLVVLLFVVHGQQHLLLHVLLVEALDGFQHKGVNHLAVIVPVERVSLDDVVEFLVGHHEGFVEFAYEFAVGLVAEVAVLHVLHEGFALRHFGVEASHEALCVVPALLPLLAELVERLVGIQL